MYIENWKTQIRKGYIELCVLLIVQAKGRVYGFDLLDTLANAQLPVKEGTIYPILNRMTVDGLLTAKWETQDIKGHPRKFYSLTKEGKSVLSEMQEEFERMNEIYRKLGRAK